MTEFSELLQFHIHKKQVKIYQLAKESGVGRTLIHKFISGERLPPSGQVVKQLAESLMLTIDEKMKFYKSYSVAKMGPEAYQLQMQILRFYHELTDLPDSSKKFPELPKSYMPSASKMVEGHWAVVQLIQNALLEESEKPGGLVQVIAQPEYADFMKMLALVAGHAKQPFAIEHLLCLENAKNEGNAIYNLHCLQVLLPIVFSNCHYTVYDYFDSIEERFGVANTIPNLILTSQAVVLVTADQSHALLLKNGEAVAFYRSVFLQQRDRMGPMLRNFSNQKEIVQSLGSIFKPQGELLCQLSDTPNLISFLPGKRFQAILENLQNSFSTEQLQYVKDLYRLSRPEQVLVTEKGLQNFLQTGQMSGVPAAFSACLTEQDRLSMLRQVEKMAQQKTCKVYYLEDNFLPHLLRFTSSFYRGGKAVFACGGAGRKPLDFLVEEKSIYMALYKFVESLPKSGWTKSEDESLRMLHILLQ